MSGDGQALRTDQVTLQTILRMGYAAYAHGHALPTHVRRAVWALLACRTAVLGGHVHACLEGHLERIWDNSCRHRLCPQCAWVQVERWLSKQKARLLACEHYHVIFTIPPELHDLWLSTVAVMLQLLFATVHDTLVTLLRDPKYLGATREHRDAPHLDPDAAPPSAHSLFGDWWGLARGWPLGRGAEWVFIAGAGGHGGLAGQTPGGHPPGVAPGTAPCPGEQAPPADGQRAEQAGPHQVACAPPGALSLWAGGSCLPGALPARGLSCEGEQVLFRYEERAKGPGSPARSGTLRLPLGQFIGRWRLHVPPQGAVLVRGWGLYAHTQGAALAVCRQQLGQGPVEAPPPWEWQRACAERGEAHPECCPICGRRLVCTALIPRAGVPPPHAPSWEQVA